MESAPLQETESQLQHSSQISPWNGIIQVFSQPSRLFAGIKENPKILVPSLVLFLVMLTFLFLTADLITKVQLELMREKAAEQGVGAVDTMPSAEMMKYMTIIFGSISVLISPLIAAGLALFFGSFVMGGQAKFKQIFSVMIYGEIIYALGALVVAPLMLAKNSLQVSFSAAAFFEDLSVQDPLYVALSKIGVFYIWEIVVIGIGLSIIFGFPRNKGYLLAVLSMGLISIFHVLSQFAFGGM